MVWKSFWKWSFSTCALDIFHYNIFVYFRHSFAYCSNLPFQNRADAFYLRSEIFILFWLQSHIKLYFSSKGSFQTFVKNGKNDFDTTAVVTVHHIQLSLYLLSQSLFFSIAISLLISLSVGLFSMLRSFLHTHEMILFHHLSENNPPEKRERK